jgi:hypothetical protein
MRRRYWGFRLMAKRSWTCQAKCNLHSTKATPPGTVFPSHIYGSGSGPDENQACRNAKADATNLRPATSHARHCRCLNCARGGKLGMTQQMKMSQIRRELTEKGIASEKAMYERLSKASKRLRLLGIRLIEDRGHISAMPLLAELLEADEEEVQMAAASALATIGGRASLLLLTGILEIERRSSVRQAAVYALAFMFQEEAFGPLISVFQNSSESPSTRGIAAEGIANLLEHSDPRGSSHKQAVATLIKALEDESPKVRFWSSFALGCLKSHQAIPHLRHLAETDMAVCRGWWSVAKEAEDALVSIQGGSPPDRIARTDEYS